MTITQRDLERYVLTMIGPELNAYRVIVKQRKKDNKAVEQERKKLQEKLRRLVDLYTDSLIDRPEYDRRRHDIEDRLRAFPSIAGPRFRAIVSPFQGARRGMPGSMR